MNIQRTRITVTTDASGDFTTSTVQLHGKILQIFYDYGDSDATADLTIVGKDTGIPVITRANLGTSDITLAPRQPIHAVGDGSAILYAAAGEAVHDHIYINEALTVTVAQGGNVTTSVLHIWVGR